MHLLKLRFEGYNSLIIKGLETDRTKEKQLRDFAKK